MTRYDDDILMRRIDGDLSPDQAAAIDTAAAADPALAARLAVAARLRELMAGSAIRDSHRDDCAKVQDPYSLRCQPQVMGAILDILNA